LCVLTANRDKAMKIALVHTQLNYLRGAERAVVLIANKLAERGHETSLFVHTIRRDGFANMFHGVELHTGCFSPLNFQRLNFDHCDVVNCHNFLSNVLAAYIKGRSSTPLVWSCNETYVWHPFFNISLVRRLLTDHRVLRVSEGHRTFLRQANFSDKCTLEEIGLRLPGWGTFIIMERVLLGRINRICTLSNMIRQEIALVYRRNSKVLYQGPDIEYLNHVAQKSEPATDFQDRQLIMTTGALVKNKRHDLLIRAFSELQHDNAKDLHLAIVGEGPEEQNLRELTYRLSMEKRVHFLGGVSEVRLVSLLRACRIFVSSAWVSWGLAPLEAMFFGKPAIVSEDAGVADILRNEEHALVIHPTVEQLKSAIVRLVQDDRFARVLGQRGKEVVSRSYNMQRYIQEFIPYLEEAVTDK